MTTSVLDIFNAAVSAAEGAARIVSLTEASREREECSLWYDVVRTSVMQAASWPACTTNARLALLATRDTSADWVSTDPSPRFTYKYQLPSDYLRAQHLSDFSSFTVETDGNNVVLMTNTKNAVLHYTKDQTAVNLWSPKQKLATIYALAAHITGALSGRAGLIQKNFQLANRLLIEAREADENADYYTYSTIPSWIAARGYADTTPPTKYFYPWGDLFPESSTDV